MTKPVTVAIDGPAGAGKSTVARRVAEELGFVLVDTGAIYRAAALLAERRNVAFNDDAGLARIVDALDVRFELCDGKNRVWVAGEDVSEPIRAPAISLGASTVSARKVVRDGLLALQRRLAGEGDAVLEGRDIGTVVFPEAAVKIYLDASPRERARRRHDELAAKGGDAPNYATVLAEVERRDAQDRERAHAPLRPADDAIILDSTRLTIEQVVERVVAAVEAVRAR